MKIIELTKGKTAIVDETDFEWLGQWKWHAINGKYAARRQWYRENGQKKSYYILMHRLIAGTPPDMDTDHKNGNTLDNRRENLRVCTTAENLANRGPLLTRNKSGYKGVCWDGKKWVAQIGQRLNDRHTNKVIGRFDDPIEAAKAYDKVSLERYGEFAKPNFAVGG